MRLAKFNIVAMAALLLASCTRSSQNVSVVKQSLPSTERECLAKGGYWTPHSPEKIWSGCFLMTTDAGKSCVSSRECQSECVEHAGGNTCADTYSGCFNSTGHGTST